MGNSRLEVLVLLSRMIAEFRRGPRIPPVLPAQLATRCGHKSPGAKRELDPRGPHGRHRALPRDGRAEPRTRMEATGTPPSSTWKSANRIFAAPPLVAEAAIEAIGRRRLGYTASIGIPELRQAISDHYRDRLSVAVPPSRIVVTAGASGAFLLTLAALVNPGDEVLMPDPCYPCNRHFVRLFEGRPRAIPSTKNNTINLPMPIFARTGAGRRAACLLASPSTRRHHDPARRAECHHRLGATGGWVLGDGRDLSGIGLRR